MTVSMNPNSRKRKDRGLVDDDGKSKDYSAVRLSSSAADDDAAKKKKKKKNATGSKRKSNSSSNNNNNNSVTGICQHVSERYEKVGRVGQGTYGIVYKARDKQTGQYVALKRCIPHHESSDGFPLTTLRELQTLRLAKEQHPNIVQLLDVTVSSTNGVFLVFEYSPHDIAQLLDVYHAKHHKSPFAENQVKTLTLQLLSALQFLHGRAILHRDIKPSNLLYYPSGGGTNNNNRKGQELQLADFGLSRQTPAAGGAPLTPNVVSLWYRAPELLWKQTRRSNNAGVSSPSSTTSSNYHYHHYSTAIDMWATGCVVAELLQGFPLLDGKTELEQMQKIVHCLGRPPPAEVYGRDRVHVKHPGDDGGGSISISNGSSSSKKGRLELWDRFDTLSKEGLGLLTMLLEYKPEERWTAQQARQSDYFKTHPLPATEMPSFPDIQQLL